MGGGSGVKCGSWWSLLFRGRLLVMARSSMVRERASGSRRQSVGKDVVMGGMQSLGIVCRGNLYGGMEMYGSADCNVRSLCWVRVLGNAL